MPGASDEERFLVLETKVAYQEKLIAELNDVLLERGREVDKLLGRVDSLERMLRDGPGHDAIHERPPHY